VRDYRGGVVRLNDFLQRLRQRKLVQWALAYIAAAFALIQVVDIVGQRFSWPQPIERAIIVALAVGFFVTMVLAWYHGDRGAQRVSGVELVILALLLAIGGVVLSRVAQGPAETQVAITAVSNRDAPAETARPPGTLPIQAKSIAVLPFENMSADKDNAYFASGMRDEILTRLAGIRDLKVISRTSTEQYSSHPADIRTVAAQLGVAAILEGSVQKAGESVHINVQLIDTQSDTHLWAESYDRDLKNLFAVERDVAEKVSDALQATLLPDEAARVASIPTDNTEAYDLYLRGLAHYNRASDEYQLAAVEIPLAVALFEQALAKDPNFALAAAALSKAHSYAYWFGPDRTDARINAAKTMADRALALKPDLGDGHYALGMYYYWGHRDYAAARHEMELARETLPNNSEVELSDAAISRRLGEFDKAVAGFKRAAELAPRGAAPNFNLAQVYMMRRQYADADRLFASAAAVMADPDLEMIRRAWNRVYWKGDLDALRVALEVAKPGTEVYKVSGLRLFEAAWLSHDYAAAAKATEADDVGDWFDATNVALPKRLYLAWAEEAAGETAKAHALYADLRTELQAAVRDHPEVAERHLALAFANAGLGMKAEAVAEGRKAAELSPLSHDAFTGPGFLSWFAKLHVRTGDTDLALDLIEKLQALPGGQVQSQATLKLDPIWDPLRDNARFQALAKKPDIVFKEAAHG
jgi:TolB-like protein/Tfp pilus assembly protein PilF